MLKAVSFSGNLNVLALRLSEVAISRLARIRGVFICVWCVVIRSG
jgi:hypothetical protein